MSVHKLIAVLLLISCFAIGNIADVPDSEITERTFFIEADFVNYISDNQFVRASGNVLVIQGDVNLRAEIATVNFENRQVSVTDGFVFNRAHHKIYGRAMNYDYKTQVALGEDIGLNLLNASIKGRQAEIYEDRIVISDAYQTACWSEDSPCSHITAKRMTIYPEWGNMINDHAMLYVFSIPVMYVPNSVSDLNGDLDNTYAAIPSLGYNPAEGNHIKFGWSFYQNEKLNGTLDFHYMTNLGFRAGFTNNYKLDQAHRGQVRMHYLTGLGGRTSYGWQHRMLLGVPHKDREEIIDDFYRGILAPSRRNYPELLFEMNNREMIGYQWVTYRPKIELSIPAFEVFNTGINYKFDGFIVNQLEENVETISHVGGVRFDTGSREFRQHNWEADIYRGFDFGDWGRMTPGMLYSDSTYYSGNELSEIWSRLIYYVNYQKSWDWLDFKAGYKYTPDERGNSPFNAESFYAGTSEESHFGIAWQVLENLKLNYEQHYSVTEGRVRDRIYGGEFKIHCWNALVNWSEYYSQFIFGLSMQL